MRTSPMPMPPTSAPGCTTQLLCQLGQRLLALDGGQSHLRLESRCVVPASGHCFSCAARILAAFRQKLHLSYCSDFQSQLSPRGTECTQERLRAGARGIQAVYRKPNTSKPAPGHKIYPYLLRDLAVTRPNQVWAMDLTY